MTADQYRKAFEQINEVRAELGAGALDTLPFDDATSGPSGCLLAASFMDTGSVWVGIRPSIPGRMTQVVYTVGARHEMPSEASSLGNEFDGATHEPDERAALRARLVEAGVVA